MSRFALYPFSCVDDVTPLHFRQLKNFGFSLNKQQSDQIPGGATDVQCSYLASANPMATFTTHDLLTFFTAMGSASVLPVTDGVFRMIERQEEGTFKTVGDTWTIPKGTIVPMSLSANQSDVDGASLQFGVVVLDDGTNPPIARATGADFSSVSTPTCISKYYLGPAYIDSTVIPNIEGTSISFGVNYQAKPFSGSIFPVEGSIITRTPSITLTSTAVKIDAARDILLSSLGGEFRQFFRRAVDNSDDRAADASTVHCKISCSAGAICSDNISVEGNDDGSVSLKITPQSALAVSLTSAVA